MNEAAVDGLVKTASGLLHNQLALLPIGAAKAMSSLATDNWSVGYTGGMTDAMLQAKGVSNEDLDAYLVMTLAFSAAYGEKGPYYFGRLMTLQAEQDADVMAGMKAGGSEFFAWRDRSEVPLGLLGHIENTK